MSVDSNGQVWVVNNEGSIYTRSGISGTWMIKDGSAYDIDARKGVVGIVTKETVDEFGGRNVLTSTDGTIWKQVNKAFNFTTVAMDLDGLPLCVTPTAGIWKRNDDNNGWFAIEGCAADFSVAHDGTYYAVGRAHGYLYIFNRIVWRWIRITGLGQGIKRVDGYSSKIYVVVNKEGEIWTNFYNKYVD